ncbi:MAG TPA: AAA family ATPase [Spirochaetaceae bacterium]|nr:AAA family ATPase [Spirochaetaceae bacterium]
MHIDFQAELDPEQYIAVTTIDGPVLIIAGAGSGKTRVITYRIAYLLSRGVPQEAILALTFTNKAASEMVQRVHLLTGLPLKSLMVSTFHSFGAWMLRKEASLLGYRSNFSIYDEEDRMRAIRESARELGMPSEKLDPIRLSQLFSARRAGYGKQGELSSRELELYEFYRKTVKVYNAMDFDDLIALPLELLENHDEVRARYRSRFRYIMIDEFQDTSLQQYAFIRQIESGNICVVGDDDQSIYSWRGADFRNIERFELDHPGLVEIKLERNYRSTGSILTAANTVIAHNTRRKKKQLWSPQGVHGTPITLVEAEDEEDEADKIIAKIRELRFREHAGWDDFGILVRTNSLTEGIEEKLVEHNVPYRVAGGPSFYQRREVKDIVAYLRAAVNPDDDVSVLRVINVPRRGIGPATIEFLSNIARLHSVSLHRAAELARQSGSAQPKDGHIHKALNEVYAFFDYLAQIRIAFLEEKRPVSAAIRNIVEDVGYWQYLLEEYKKSDKVAVWKYRNIELLAASAERWEKDPDTFEKDIFAYLARISLTVRDDAGEEERRLSLLTIHAAKGLEFDYVFIPGCENGILPHARSVEESGNIEEERRLFYVAVTRAKKQLFISRAMQRKKNGSLQETAPSPFLGELPQDLIVMAEEQVRPHNEDELKKEFFSRLKSRLGA